MGMNNGSGVLCRSDVQDLQALVFLYLLMHGLFILLVWNGLAS